jgi:hypothetical protein
MQIFLPKTSIIPTLLLLFSISMCIHAASSSEKSIRKGALSMSNGQIQLILKDFPERIITGGSIHGTVEIKNLSGKTVSVPAMTPVSPVLFTFENISAKYKKVFSHQSFINAMQSGRSVPQPGIQTVSLKAGDSISQKTGDLSTYAIAPFPEGEYQVTASLSFEGAIITSTTKTIHVCAPAIRMIETMYSALFSTALSVFIEDKCYSPQALLLRESYPNNPSIGVSGQPFSLMETIEGIAVCEKIGNDIPGRWIGRIGKEKLIASWGDINFAFKDFGSVEFDLKSPVLYPQGFTVHENTGLFFVTGKKESRTVLQPCYFSDKSALKKMSIPLSDNDVVALQVQFDLLSKSYTILWIERSASVGYSLKYGRYRSDSNGSLDDIRLLLTSRFSPVALTMQSTAQTQGEQQGKFTALFIDEQKKQLSFFQDHAGSHNRPIPVTIPVPPGVCKEWSVAPSYDYHPLVLTHSEDHLMWFEVGGDNQWKVFAHDSKGVSHLEQFTNSQNEYWAHWVNRETGIRFERIPYMIKPAR